MNEHDTRARKVECIGCHRWFSVARKNHGWACPACSASPPESTRESNPTPDNRRIDAP